jgi:hypothetical protein
MQLILASYALLLFSISISITSAKTFGEAQEECYQSAKDGNEDYPAALACCSKGFDGTLYGLGFKVPSICLETVIMRKFQPLARSI